MQKNTENGADGSAEKPQGSQNVYGSSPREGGSQETPPMYSPPTFKDYFKRDNPQGIAIIGFVLALCSFLGAFAPVAGLICAVLGIVLCVLGQRSTRRGTAVAGTMVSVFGLVISLLSLFMSHQA